MVSGDALRECKDALEFLKCTVTSAAMGDSHTSTCRIYVACRTLEPELGAEASTRVRKRNMAIGAHYSALPLPRIVLSPLESE